MNKHYTESDVNTDVLEKFIFEGERRRRDRYIAILFILIGATGLYFITKSSSKTDQPLLHNPIYKQEATMSQLDHSTTSQTVIAANNIKPTVPSKKKRKQQQLKINGNMEAHEAISFTIDSFDKNASYVLRLGNGISKSVRSKTVKYRYPQSGSYKVELDVTYQGQTEKLAQKTIEIMEAIAVAPTAAAIDF